MAGPRTLATLYAPVTAAVLLAASGCGGAAVEEAADAGAVAAEEGPPPPGDVTPPDHASSSSHGSSAVRSAGGPDVDAEAAGTRPGAPFDVEAFEQVGSSYAEFLASDPGSHCAAGACTLTYEFVPTADHDSGCWVEDFENHPPARPEGAQRSDQFLQQGTAVTAVIGCAPGVDPADVDTVEEAFGGP